MADAGTGNDPFGPFLRRLRTRARLSQEALSERAFVSVRTISDLERGVNARPRRDTARALARALELEGADLATFEALAEGEGLRGGGRDSNVPAPLTPLIGRGAELRMAQDLVTDPKVRLVTLTGPGGVGKSRLALEVARVLADDDRRIVVVMLGAVPMADQVPAVVAAALRVVRSGPDPLQQRIEAKLCDQAQTLLLDNLEHLAGIERWIADLLGACSGLTVLATSRSRLGIPGEHELQVGPLQVPPEGSVDEIERYPSVMLFAERAKAMEPTWQLEGATTRAVAELCRTIDGLPLAIELAAARLNVLTPHGITERLRVALDLLEDEHSMRPAHQQTLRATYDWSLALLDEPARRWLRRLAVLPVGGSLDTAVVVCADPDEAELEALRAIGQLVDNSLLSRSAQHETPRFTMLETVRRWAYEGLLEFDDADWVHRNLRTWGRDLAVQLGSDPSRYGELAHDHANVLAALDSAIRTDLRLAAEIGANMWRFWQAQGFWEEGLGHLSSILDSLGRLGIADGPCAKAAGNLARSLGQLDRARGYYDAALAAYVDAGDRRGEAAVWNNLGVIEFERGRFEAARLIYVKALAAAGDDQDHFLLTTLHNNTGIAFVALQQVSAAVKHLTVSVREARIIDDLLSEARALDNLADALEAGDHERLGLGFRLAAMRIRDEIRDLPGLVLSYEGVGRACISSGRLAQASQAFAAARSLRDELGYHPDVYAAARMEHSLARLAEAGGPPPDPSAPSPTPADMMGWFNHG